MTERVEQGLTGRDVIAKTFSTRTRRGYDPIEVDAFLEEVAGQIDAMSEQVDRAKELAVAPPPPPPPEPIAEPVDAVPAVDPEAAEMVLRMAQKAAADAIDEARKRADEIVAEAEFQASEIQREADRKAFESSTRTQGELRGVESQIEARSNDLIEVQAAITAQRDRMREFAADLGVLADGIDVGGAATGDVVDLRGAESLESAEADSADLGG